MMPPKDKKRSLPPYVLSNLPENVIDEILIRMPLRDAVRTSILARKWRYTWCRLPQLKLDQTLWEPTKDLKSLTIKFSDIIYHLVTLHVGPISSFILSVPKLGSCPKIDNLICFLSRNDIQCLVLQFDQHSDPYKLPSSLFACLQLKHLTLKKCLLCPPSVFKGFDRLITLQLYHISISSEFLGKLISHSPFLEHLLLERLYELDHIEIDAPKLRSFVFIGFLRTIRLKNVPLLAKVIVQFVPGSVKAGMHNLAKFIESIPALENLRWLGSTFRLIAGPGDIPRRLSFDLNCLRYLHLYLICLDRFVELSGALCLIRSSPYLEFIEMQGYLRFPPVEYPEPDRLLSQATKKYIDELPASFSEVTLNHLKAVKLEGIYGTKPEMQLIKILLAKSPALVRMEINPHVEKDESLKVLAEITKFQRASSKAEVVYHIDKRPIYSYGDEKCK